MKETNPNFKVALWLNRCTELDEIRRVGCPRRGLSARKVWWHFGVGFREL